MHQRSLVNKQGHIGSIIVFTYSISVLFFQLMATGEYGASGAHVRRLVNRENNQEPVNVIHQLHSMEERNVMARHRRVKFVTTTYPVQVSYECRQTRPFPRYLVLMLQNEVHEKSFTQSLVWAKISLYAQPIFIWMISHQDLFTQRQKATRNGLSTVFYFSPMYSFWFLSIAGFSNLRLFIFAGILLKCIWQICFLSAR